MCSQCIADKSKNQRDQYFENLWELYTIKKSGYPVEKDDWELSVWLDLYALDLEVEKYKIESIKKN